VQLFFGFFTFDFFVCAIDCEIFPLSGPNNLTKNVFINVKKVDLPAAPSPRITEDP
jgi:hypothetical protein